MNDDNVSKTIRGMFHAYKYEIQYSLMLMLLASCEDGVLRYYQEYGKLLAKENT